MDETTVIKWIRNAGVAVKMPFSEFLTGERLPYLQTVLGWTWPQNAPSMKDATVAGKYPQDQILAEAEKMEI